MSVVHSMLSQEHWDPIDLGSMITLLVPPGAKGTLEMELNPAVLVPPQQATACGMVFQELMANSLKYGAWSAGGVVHVIWSAPDVEEDGSRRLGIHWRETGGPAIEQEIEPGTGTGLIEGFVNHELQGSITFRYDQDGVLTFGSRKGSINRVGEGDDADMKLYNEGTFNAVRLAYDDHSASQITLPL